MEIKVRPTAACSENVYTNVNWQCRWRKGGARGGREGGGHLSAQQYLEIFVYKYNRHV